MADEFDSMRNDISDLKGRVRALEKFQAGEEAVNVWKRRFIGTAITAGLLMCAVIALIINHGA